MGACARACPSSACAVSHWPQHKKQCGKPGSKPDAQATTPAEPRAASQGVPLGGASDGELGGGGGAGVGVSSSGEAGRACSACGLSGRELSECADCRSTWYRVHDPPAACVAVAVSVSQYAPRPQQNFARLMACACVLCPGRYCSKVCQRAHWKGGHKRECDDLKTLRELQAEFAEMQGTQGFENYDPMHPPTMADISSLSAQ